MSKFVKSNKIVSLDILGNVYKVNFGKDEIVKYFGEAADEIEKLKSKVNDEDISFKEKFDKVFEETKNIYKETINNILGDTEASDKIFAEDDSMNFIEDVYSYISLEYAKTKANKLEQFSPNRAQRRASK